MTRLLSIFLIPRNGPGTQPQRTDLLASAGVELLKLLYVRACLLEAYQRLVSLQSDELALLEVASSYYINPPDSAAAAWYPLLGDWAKRWASNAYFAGLVAVPVLTGICAAFGASFQYLGSLLLLASHLLLDNVADFRFFLNLFFVAAFSPWLGKRAAGSHPNLPSLRRKAGTAASLLLGAGSLCALGYLLVDVEALARGWVVAPRQDLQQLLLSWSSRDTVAWFILAVHGWVLLAVSRSTVRLWSTGEYAGAKRLKLVLEFASAALASAVFVALLAQQLVLALGFAPTTFYSDAVTRELTRSLQGAYGRDRVTEHFPVQRAPTPAGLGLPVYHFEAYLTRVGSDKPGIWREVNLRGKVGSLAKPVQLLGGLDASRFTRLLGARAGRAEELPQPLLVALLRFRRHKETFGGRFSLQLFTADLANYNLKSLEQVEVRLLRVKKSFYKRNSPGAAAPHWTRTPDASFAPIDIEPLNELALQESVERSLGSKVSLGPANRPPNPLARLINFRALF